MPDSEDWDEIAQWVADLRESEPIDLWEETHRPEDLLEAYEASKDVPIVLSLSEIIEDIEDSKANPPF